MTRDELVAAYTAPGRHYHNLAHIEDCLAALARMEGDSVEHADLHADFAELRKPPSLPTQRCASFAFSRTCTPPAQLSLWRTGWR